tara:strand:- start:154 stop:954 length:801 start_codon:yes stop_codon:yes gene_type:complete
VLEDIGYEAVDNLPLSLVERIIPRSPLKSVPLALGIDSRTRDFSAEKVVHLIKKLRRRSSLISSFLFLDCDDYVLIRRFEETRRRHPMAIDRSVTDGIYFERELLKELRQYADICIDTSEFNIGALKRLLSGHFGLTKGASLSIFVISFSFKIGIPRNSDIVLDVRFLSNPYYNRTLRKLNGRDEQVRKFLENDEGYKSFVSSLKELLEILLPRYRDEGKSYLTIALGCSGGRHRSVAIAEFLADWLETSGWPRSLEHRDLEKFNS